MSGLLFNIPIFPLRGRFGDPYRDFELEAESLAELASRAPSELSIGELSYLFNGFLPAGTFEEMAPYVPYALRYLAQDEPVNGDGDLSMLLENLIIWCCVERRALLRESALLTGLQKGFELLFEHWTNNTRWYRHVYSPGHSEPHLSAACRIASLLNKGDWIAEKVRTEEDVFPWLRSAYYQPRLFALDSVAHAAWVLRLTDRDCTVAEATFPISTSQRRCAVEMVENWLLTDACPDEVELWDPVLIRHRELLYLFPDKP